MTTDSKTSSEVSAMIKDVDVTTCVEVSGTPFSIVGSEGKFLIVIGNTIASKKTFKTYSKARDYIITKPWELITSIAISYAQFINDQNKKDNAN